MKINRHKVFLATSLGVRVGLKVRSFPITIAVTARSIGNCSTRAATIVARMGCRAGAQIRNKSGMRYY